MEYCENGVSAGFLITFITVLALNNLSVLLLTTKCCWGSVATPFARGRRERAIMAIDVVCDTFYGLFPLVYLIYSCWYVLMDYIHTVPLFVRACVRHTHRHAAYVCVCVCVCCHARIHSPASCSKAHGIALLSLNRYWLFSSDGNHACVTNGLPVDHTMTPSGAVTPHYVCKNQKAKFAFPVLNQMFFGGDVWEVVLKLWTRLMPIYFATHRVKDIIDSLVVAMLAETRVSTVATSRWRKAIRSQRKLIASARQIRLEVSGVISQEKGAAGQRRREEKDQDQEAAEQDQEQEQEQGREQAQQQDPPVDAGGVIVAGGTPTESMWPSLEEPPPTTPTAKLTTITATTTLGQSERRSRNAPRLARTHPSIAYLGTRRHRGMRAINQKLPSLRASVIAGMLNDTSHAPFRGKNKDVPRTLGYA